MFAEPRQLVGLSADEMVWVAAGFGTILLVVIASAAMIFYRLGRSREQEDRPVRGMRFHGAVDCTPPCPIHAPSDHHMVAWPRVWRHHKGVFERQCPEHGTGHPDFDSLNYLRKTQDDDAARVAGIHGCCGCCTPPAGVEQAHTIG